MHFLQNLQNTRASAVQNSLLIAIVEMSHPMIYTERIERGFPRDKVTEWIWVGWCLCEISEAPIQERASDEPYCRCTICRKFVKELGRRSFLNKKSHDDIHPFNNLEEALASLKKDLEHTDNLSSTLNSSAARPANSVDNNAEQPALKHNR